MCAIALFSSRNHAFFDSMTFHSAPFKNSKLAFHISSDPQKPQRSPDLSANLQQVPTITSLLFLANTAANSHLFKARRLPVRYG